MKPTLYGADKPLRNNRTSLRSCGNSRSISTRNEHVVEARTSLMALVVAILLGAVAGAVVEFVHIA